MNNQKSNAIMPELLRTGGEGMVSNKLGQTLREISGKDPVHIPTLCTWYAVHINTTS